MQDYLNHKSRLKNEKIIIKNENATTPNIKEKHKKVGEKEIKETSSYKT